MDSLYKSDRYGISDFLKSKKAYSIQTVAALAAFIPNNIALCIIFFAFYLCIVLLYVDDITYILSPICLTSLAVLKQRGAEVSDFLIYIPCVVMIVLCMVLHIVIYRPSSFRCGKYFPSLCAVAVAVTIGGAFSISVRDYFAPTAMFYTLLLGVCLPGVYLVVKNYTPVGKAETARAVSEQMLFVSLCGFAMVFASIMPYIRDGAFDWFFNWKNSLSSVMLISSAFCFYLAAQKCGRAASCIYFLSGIAGYAAGILSMSRGGMIFGSAALVLCVIAACIFCRRENRLPLISIAAVLAALCAVLIIVKGDLFAEMLKTAQIDGNESRIHLYKEAWANFLAYPVFGVGLGYKGDMFYPLETSLYWYHSTLFQIIGSMGVVGIMAYAFNYISKLRIMLSARSKFNLFLFLSFLGYELYQMVDVGTFVPIPFVFLTTHIFAAAEAVGDSKYIPAEEYLSISRRLKNA